MTNLLKKLMMETGVSGRENKIRALIEKECAPYADEIITDNMGNLIVHKRGKGKRIAFCAHMDEIGFFVTYINSDGTLSISPVGGISFLASAFTEVVSENGVCGILVPSECKEIPKSEDVYIDIGAKNAKQAEKYVKIGDYFVVKPTLTKLLNSKYIGRPFDDRVGCAILIEALKQVKNPENDLYFVFSVQEEVGARGSKPAAYQLKPDYSIALDVTMTGDKPGSPKMTVTLGGGCTVKIKDSGLICNQELVSKMKDIASNNKIKYQDEVLLAGGTDASSMQVAGAGSKAGVISIPTANIHTGVEMFDINDVKEAVKLTVALSREL